jgi:predicted GIY-YIG superfamily endonuclease
MAYIKPSPEEQARRTAKAIATRRANKAAHKAAMQDAYERQYLLKDEIKELENKLQIIQQLDTMNEVSNKVASKTLASAEAILKAAKPWQSFTGVYFLISNNKIVYVGQSVNVYARISGHAGKTFDSFTVIPCPREHLNVLESLYIHMFDPPLNGHEKSNCAPLSLEKILRLSVSS